MKTFIKIIATNSGLDPPHILAQEFQNILIGFIQKRMKSTKQPKSKHSFPRNLWFDEECKALKRSVNNAKKLFLQDINTLSRKEYFLQKRRYRKIIKTKKYQAQEKLHSILLTAKYKNPKEFWALINRERRESKPRVYLDPDIFYFHFKSLHGIKEPVGGLCQQQIGSYVPELDEVISFEEVCMAIKSMKPRKSPGVDGISIEVYKALPDHLVQLLTKIFNGILVTGEYPASWSVGLICPIYKAGEKEEPNTIEESPC